MVALAIGRCQFRIQGSSVTELSPLTLPLHVLIPQPLMTLGSGPFALHTARCTAGCESNTRWRNMFPVEAAVL
jgi:hypothetical protein